MRRLRWWLVGLLIAAAGAAYLNRDTWLIYSEQAELKQRNEARMRDAEKERADLLRKRSSIESSIGREEAAREQGYKKRNETPLNDLH